MQNNTDNQSKSELPDYYFHSESGKSLILHSFKAGRVFFFDPSSHGFVDYSSKDFGEMICNNILQRARYVLSYSFSPESANAKPIQFLSASNDLPALKDKLNQMRAVVVKPDTYPNDLPMRLNDVFLKDQLEQKYLFKSDNLSEFINNVKEKKNVSINETKKEFKPSAVDITHALNQHQTSETNTKQKSHGR
jgi:hypothetical protein